MVRTVVTALLTADEAARLVPGERLVIVRAGDLPSGIAGTRQRMYEMGVPAGTDHPSLIAQGAPPLHQIADPPGRVAPQVWVALTGPCPQCLGVHRVMAGPDYEVDCTWCRDGRRIVPLYARHWCFNCDRANENECHACDKLVGRGSIAVVPVVGALHGEPGFGFQGPRIIVSPSGVFLVIPGQIDTVQLTLDPLPVPGRDFGIVIDCVEVAPQ